MENGNPVPDSQRSQPTVHGRSAKTCHPAVASRKLDGGKSVGILGRIAAGSVFDADNAPRSWHGAFNKSAGLPVPVDPEPDQPHTGPDKGKHQDFQDHLFLM